MLAAKILRWKDDIKIEISSLSGTMQVQEHSLNSSAETSVAGGSQAASVCLL